MSDQRKLNAYILKGVCSLFECYEDDGKNKIYRMRKWCKHSNTR